MMKTFLKQESLTILGLILVLGALFIGFYNDENTPPTHRQKTQYHCLQPGQAIAGIQLKQSPQQLTQKLGQPTHIQTNAIGTTTAQYANFTIQYDDQHLTGIHYIPKNNDKMAEQCRNEAKELAKKQQRKVTVVQLTDDTTWKIYDGWIHITDSQNNTLGWAVVQPK